MTVDTEAVFDSEVERAYLGAVLAGAPIAKNLKDSDFYCEARRIVFRSCCAVEKPDELGFWIAAGGAAYSQGWRKTKVLETRP